jgi:hypothetical protein
LKNITNDIPEVIWFAYARQALEFGLKTYGLKNPCNLLVPAFICDVIEHSVASVGIEIIYYDINKDLTFNNTIVTELLRNNIYIKALLWVNYFGYPTSTIEVKRFCQCNNLLFIEDNAHGFNSSYNGQSLGTYGDFSITSVRKTLPIVHGAQISINKEIKDRSKFSYPSYDLEESISGYYFRIFLTYIKNRIKCSSIIKKHIKKIYSRGNLTNYEGKNDIKSVFMNVKINSIVPLIVEYVNKKKLSLKKSISFHKITKFLEEENENGVILKLPLDSTTMPWSIPFKLKNNQLNIGYWIQHYTQLGYIVSYWPDLPSEVKNNVLKYPISNYLQKNIIHFHL